VRWAVARRMISGRGVSLEEGFETNNYAIGVEGRRYAYYGLGQSLIMSPFAAIGLGLAKLRFFGADRGDLAGQFLASVVLFPAIGAAAVLLVYRLGRSIGASRRACISTAMVFGIGTMHWHYSVNGQEQSQVELLLVAAAIGFLAELRCRRFLYAWLTCAALGACVLFRPASIVVVVAAYGTMVIWDTARTAAGQRLRCVGRWIAAGILGAGAFAVACGWYNVVRFGTIFETGYRHVAETAMGGHTMFEASPLPTLAAMLASPGKSIVLYNPVLLLLPFCVAGFYRRYKPVAALSAVVVGTNFVLYSFCTTWAGDYAWSVRYQAAVMAFLVLPLVALFDRPTGRAGRLGIIVVIGVSSVIQLASVVYNFNLEFVQNPNHCLIPDGWVWDWSQSHLKKRFENIARHIAGKRDYHSAQVEQPQLKLLKFQRNEKVVKDAYTLNFFPFKARRMLGGGGLWRLLLCGWAILGGGLSAAGWQLWKSWRSATESLQTLSRTG